MFRILLSVIILALCGIGIYAQDYSVSSIPAELRENADLVIRDYTREWIISDVNAGLEKTRKVITVLNKDGENSASLVLNYDKDMSADIKQITIYDPAGKKIKNVKLSEVEDQAAFGGSELFSDQRVKVYRPVIGSNVYTIEYVYEIKARNVISFGAWRPVNSYNTSVEKASFRFTKPAIVKVNSKELNIARKSYQSLGNNEGHLWEVTNMKAILQEPYSTNPLDLIPCVYLMPEVLRYDSYTGSAATWKDFGKWIYSLYEGRDALSDADKKFVTELAGQKPATEEMIKKLYTYVQEKTRYVAIMMGLGGFQPFDALTVSKTGYGDCKALTNYLCSLLKTAGITSYPALVSSGKYKEPIHREFPNFQQFDHVILCVPGKKDTTWLECTDQNIPFGFLGSFTDDRDVLLVTPEGGIFSHTPRYGENENVRVCRSEFNISPDGNAEGSMLISCRGLQYDNISDVLVSSYEDQKKYLLSSSMLPSVQISSFSIENNKETNPAAVIKKTVASKGLCTFSGNYMILPLNLVNVQKPIAKMMRKRSNDILISRSYLDYDTVVYTIPAYMKIQPLQGTTVVSKFGSYSSGVVFEGNKIIYTRKLLLKEGSYKPEDYNDLYDFILSVSKSDNLKIMIDRS